HAMAQVVHAADAGKLIDAIAGETEHGTEAELLDAGYGAGRPFPFHEDGMVVTGPDAGQRAVGRPLPMPTVDSTRLDLRIGSGFGVVARSDPRSAVDDTVAKQWDELGTAWVAVGDDPWLVGIVDDDRIAIVRP